MNVNNYLNFASDSLNLDVRYFLKGSFYGVGQQFVGLICGAAVTYLIGHYVPQAAFGEYNLLLSTISLLTFFSLPGIDTALVRAVSQGSDGIYRTGLKLKIKLSLLGSLALIGFAIFYLLNQRISLSFNLMLAALVFPLIYSFTIFLSFLTAKQKFKTIALLSTFGSVWFLTSIAVSIWTKSFLFYGYLVGTIIPAVIGYLYTKRYLTNTHTDASTLTYGSFLTLVSVIPWVSGSLGNIILGNLLGYQSLALYSVAINILISFQKMYTVFYKTVVAKIARQSATQHTSTIKIHAVKLIMLGIIMYAGLWFTVPIIIKFFFAPSYLPVIGYTRLLLLAIIPLPLSWVASDMIIFQRRRRVQVLLSTLPQLIRIGLYFLLIPRWGVAGLIVVILLDRYTLPLFHLAVLLRSKS